MGKHVRNRKNLDGDMSDFIFSWTVEDVRNKNLLREQVTKIPTTFSSVQEYLGSYVFPLIEEVRAHLYSSLELISHSPVCKVLYLEESSKPSGKLLYDICVDPLDSAPSLGNKETYRPKHGDIFALAKGRPQNVTDLDRDGISFTLALVKVAEDRECGPPYDIQVKLSKQMLHQKGRTKSLFAVFLLNIITNVRIWKVLHVKGSRERNQNIVKKVLGTHSLVNHCDVCSTEQTKKKLSVKLDACLQSIMLNASQFSATLMSLLVSQCPHNESIELIWGPPGTGKTRTVSALLLALFSMKCRTLACAPTNVAVLELASRLIEMVKFSQGDLCSLGGIVLFGDKDRMQIEGDLEQIFLDYRVDRLTNCFAMFSGWNHQLAALVALLEDAGNEYNMYLVLNKERAEKEDHETCKREGVTFSAFIKRRFKTIADNLNKYHRDLIVHLPPNCFPNDSSKLMIKLQKLLGAFEYLLTNNNVSQKETWEAFKGVKMDDQGKNELFETRMEILHIIKALQGMLKIPNFLDKNLISQFCIKGASLVFCTVSNSFKLYSAGIMPLHLLVIDEATQLKECESLIPLQLPGIQHSILIGDERQLPAMIRSKIAEKAQFGRSLFERLASLGHMKHLLNMQYRMHPEISCFPNAKFYHNKILDAENVKLRDYDRHFLPGRMYGSYSFINVDCGKEVSVDSYSQQNMVEVAVVSQIIKSLFDASSKSEQRFSIGIISPYMAQVIAIQKKIENYCADQNNISVRVKSIDGFQGGEEDVIIISTVRSNDKGLVGFLSDHRRTNVALTRARYCLWIVGSAATLTASNSVWKKIVNDARKRRSFFNAREDANLFEAIIRVHIELNQMDNLFYANSLLFNKAQWKVIFTDEFKKSFTRIKSTQIQIAVIDLLMKLSSGWRPQKRQPELGNHNPFQLLKQCGVQGHHLFWTVEIKKEKTYIQVLKFWDISSLTDTPKVVGSLESILSKYPNSYIESCKFKHAERGAAIPMSWDSCPAIYHLQNVCRTDAGEDLLTHLASLSLEDKVNSLYVGALQDSCKGCSSLNASPEQDNGRSHQLSTSMSRSRKKGKSKAVILSSGPFQSGKAKKKNRNFMASALIH